MSENSWIYSSLIVSICSAMFGTGVSGYIFWGIWRKGQTLTVQIAWLLFVITAMSFAQLIEQTRVLGFRLSYDGVIDRTWFEELYSGTWHVVLGKMLFACSLSVGTVLLIALQCKRSNTETAAAMIAALIVTIGAWMLIALKL